MSISSIFDQDEFTPYAGRWKKRQDELTRRQSYYDGSVYSDTMARLKWFGPRFNQGVRPLYLPLSRAVDVDAGVIPGGWTLAERSMGLAAAQQKVFDWSRWDTLGVLYVHYGAQYGVSGLKIADLRDDKKVIISTLDPTTFMLIRKSQYDDTPDMALVIETREDAEGKQFEYGEVITPETIRTYHDGMPQGFDDRAPNYANELGFVPFVEIYHIRTGSVWGEATYQKAIPLLDEVNTLATSLANIIGKHAEPQWAIIGAEASDMQHSGDNIWFIPNGGDAKILVPDIDIEGVLEFVREIRDQVKGALPELGFDEFRAKENVATATVELQLMELVLKIKRTRPNYDEGLVDALRMAGRAAASMGIGDLAGLDVETLSLDAARPILPLDPLTAIRIEMESLALERERALGTREGVDDAGPTTG